jgi:signal peptidase II
MSKNLLIFLIISICIILLDQSSKLYVERRMLAEQTIPVIENIVRITFVHNQGAAFGLPLGGRTFFVIVSTLAIGLIIFYYHKVGGYNGYYSSSLGLVLGGAIGNLTDRVRLGKVIDFIDIGINSNSRWPVFNIADIAVTIGIFALIFLMMTHNNSNDGRICESQNKELNK